MRLALRSAPPGETKGRSEDRNTREGHPRHRRRAVVLGRLLKSAHTHAVRIPRRRDRRSAASGWLGPVELGSHLKLNPRQEGGGAPEWGVRLGKVGKGWSEREGRAS